MESIFLSAAASAATTVAALGYSLPHWFETVVFVFLSLIGLSFLFSSPRLFSRLLGFFKSSEDTNSDEET